MDDKQILDLYWERSEAAISETSKKYGKYCRYIAFNILHNDEDSEECVNDTYLRAWNSIPPNRPSVLKTFLGKWTVRRIWCSQALKTYHTHPATDIINLRVFLIFTWEWGHSNIRSSPPGLFPLVLRPFTLINGKNVSSVT